MNEVTNESSPTVLLATDNGESEKQDSTNDPNFDSEERGPQPELNMKVASDLDLVAGLDKQVIEPCAEEPLWGNATSSSISAGTAPVFTTTTADNAADASNLGGHSRKALTKRERRREAKRLKDKRRRDAQPKKPTLASAPALVEKLTEEIKWSFSEAGRSVQPFTPRAP
jgi:hypothetical protein